MKLIKASFLIAFITQVAAFGEGSISLVVPNRPVANDKITVFNCTFENSACDFELVEPYDFSDNDNTLRWLRRQGSANVLTDHTLSGSDGVFLYANGDEPKSMTRVETALASPAIECPAALCCFNAYALMKQSSQLFNNNSSPGSLVFSIVQDSFGADPISTILANMSFTSFGNFWTNVQRTFHANHMPFRISIETNNGGGGTEFFAAIDDITIESGICKSDEEMFGGREGFCGAPPPVVGGEAIIPYGHSLNVGGQVNYQCSLGHDLIGPSSITCLLDGRWSETPICSPIRHLSRNFAKLEGELPSEILLEERPANGDVSSILALDCIWGDPFRADQAPYLNEFNPITELILFPENPITCSGSLIRWVFMTAPAADGTPVYLSVWRPANDGTSNQYTLIGFNQFTTQKSQRTVNYVVPATKRFEVRAGDVIGVIHKRTTRDGAVYMHSTSSMTAGIQPNDFYPGVRAQLYLEDVDQENEARIAVDPNDRVRVYPLLQAHVGSTDCPEQILDGVTFSGINTVVQVAQTEDNCWNFCRDQPSCYAVTFDSWKRECRVYSYISTEVHYTANVRSMVKLCKADCDMKLLSDGEKFDLAFEGSPLELGPSLETAAECELACRYIPECTAFSYSNPFRAGTCVLLTSTPRLQREQNRRSFRKWGCKNIDKIQNCRECTASFQCQENSQCIAVGRNDKSYCVPGGDIRQCADVMTDIGIIFCPNPPSLDYGTLISQGRPLLGPLQYACNRGYEMVGGPTVECINGNWQRLPVCRPNCPTRPTVENGIVELISVETSPMQQVTVTCNNGYRLYGNPVVSCVSPNQWSALPTCVAQCGLPPGVRYAEWSVIEGTQEVPVAVRYDCNAGFFLSGSPQLRCVNGVWTPAAPTCQVQQPLSSCPSPPSITNGRIEDNGDFGQNSGTKYASYSCLAGYEMIGEKTIYCRGQSWEQPPVCRASCPDIPTIANARTKVLETRNGQPAKVQYECLDGFRMEGAPIINCFSSVWSIPPTCVNGTKEEYCGQPPGVVHGSWKAVLQLGDNPISVEYCCDEGYQLIGPTRLTCMKTENGACWQPAVIPLCQRVSYFPFGTFQLPHIPMIPSIRMPGVPMISSNGLDISHSHVSGGGHSHSHSHGLGMMPSQSLLAPVQNRFPRLQPGFINNDVNQNLRGHESQFQVPGNDNDFLVGNNLVGMALSAGNIGGIPSVSDRRSQSQGTVHFVDPAVQQNQRRQSGCSNCDQDLVHTVGIPHFQPQQQQQRPQMQQQQQQQQRQPSSYSVSAGSGSGSYYHYQRNPTIPYVDSDAAQMLNPMGYAHNYGSSYNYPVVRPRPWQLTAGTNPFYGIFMEEGSNIDGESHVEDEEHGQN